MSTKPNVMIAKELFEVPEGGDPYLVGGRCRQCGHEFFPTLKYCPQCFEESIDEMPLSSTGAIYSWARVVQAPAGFIGPYVLGYADFSGFRIFGTIIGDDPRIGARVKLEVGPIRETEENTYSSYRFRINNQGG